MAAGDWPLAASLQIVLACLAVVTTPLLLRLFEAHFALVPGMRAPMLEIGTEVAVVSLFPVGIGIAIRSLLPRVAAAIEHPLDVVVRLMVGVLALALISSAGGSILEIGLSGIAATITMAALAIATGHAAAAANLPARVSVATACIARNLGLAYVVGAQDDLLPEVLPTLVAYMFLGIGVAMAYAVWVRRRMRADQA